jgi:hypothetical protein
VGRLFGREVVVGPILHAQERTPEEIGIHGGDVAQFLRIKSRRGPKKAIVAVAASMLTAMYYMLRDGTEFHDLGDQHFAQRDKTRVANRLIQRLRDLGVDVEIKAA